MGPGKMYVKDEKYTQTYGISIKTEEIEIEQKEIEKRAYK